MLGSKAKGARKNGAISGRFPEMSADFPAATTRLSSSRATLLSSSYPRVRASLWLYGRALNRDFGGCPVCTVSKATITLSRHTLRDGNASSEVAPDR